MKSFYSCIFFLLCFNIKSQTLTQSFNEPQPGDRQTTLNLDTSAFTTGLPHQTGNNILWDFSQLRADSFAFTTTYEAPSASSYSASYPNSTAVQMQGGFLSVFLRSASTPSAMTEVLGIRSTSLSTTFTDPAIAAVYPISMGYQLTDNLAGTFTMSGVSGNCTGNIKSTADGTGTLTLPDGITYNNVIRLKTTQTMTGTQGFFTATLKQTNIDYYDTSEKFPVLTISYTSISTILGSTVTASASGNAKSFLVSLNENDKMLNSITFFPNPAREQVTISIPGAPLNVQLKITDQQGRLLRVHHLAPEKNTFSVKDLSPGVYLLILEGERLLLQGKLVIE